MANNRFDRIIKKDYKMQQYTPQFQLWDKMLGQLQSEKDIAEEASAMIPKYYKGDQDSFDKYTQGNQKQIDDLTQIYMSNNIPLARREQGKLMRRLKRDQQPGGIFNQLQQRHTGYNESIKSINDKYKKDPAFMTNSAMGRLQSSINPNALSEGISAPTMGAYVNTAKDVDALIKGWKSNKGVMTKGLNGKWIWTNTREEVTRSEISNAVNQIMGQPRFQEQLGIESSMLAKGLTQQDKDDYVDKFSKIKGVTQNEVDELNNMSIDEFAANQIKDQYANPLIEKYSFHKDGESVKANRWKLQEDNNRKKKEMLETMYQRLDTSTTLPYNAPSISIDPKVLSKNRKDANKGLVSATDSMDDFLVQSGLNEYLGDASAATHANEAYKKSGGDPVKFQQLLTKYMPVDYGANLEFTKDRANQLFDKLNGLGSSQLLEDEIQNVASAQSNVSMFDRVDQGITDDFNNTKSGKTYLKNTYDKLVKQGQNFDSYESFVRIVSDGAATSKPVSAWAKSIGYEKTGLSKVVESYRVHRDNFLISNPNDLKSLHSVGIVATGNTAEAGINKLATKSYKDTGGMAYTSQFGGDLIYTEIDDRDNSHAKGAVRDVTVNSAVAGGDNLYHMTGHIIKDGKKIKVTAFGKMTNANAKLAIGHKGAESFGETFDTPGNQNTSKASSDQRSRGAVTFFNSHYKNQFDLNTLSTVRPNNNKVDLDVSYIDGDGLPQIDIDSKMKGVSYVGGVTINETFRDIDVYTKREGGRQVYFIVQDANGSNLPIRDSENKVKTFLTLADVISEESGLGQIATKAYVTKHGLWKKATGSNTVLSNQSKDQKEAINAAKELQTHILNN